MSVKNPSPKTGNWYRGQLHAHTYWSDGRGFMEQAVAAHRARGYHFLFVTDHNRFADQPDTWRSVAETEGNWPPSVSRERFLRYRECFGSEWVEQRVRNGQTEVRLKTVAEVKQKLDVPDSFLLLPGVEITQVVRGRNVHLNVLNLQTLLPSLRNFRLNQPVETAATARELIARNARDVVSTASGKAPPRLLMLNHPFWRYYDIDPQDVFDRPEIRLVELCSSADYLPATGHENYTLERFWDIANAFRLRSGIPPLFGVGADDAHFYDPERIDGIGGVGGAWIMVWAKALSPDALIRALLQGHFYATCGVLLDTVDFSPQEQTLRVKVKAQAGARYRIQFVTTPRQFNPAMSTVPIMTGDGKVQRNLPVFSDAIGRVAAVVEGEEAAYRLAPDDLFVRACITADRPVENRKVFQPPFQTAWTQPCFVP